MNIPELYKALNNSPSGHTYTAAVIQGWKNAYLAVNPTGRPALIVETDTKLWGPSLRAAKVSLRPSQEFNITIDDKNTGWRTFHCLVCESSERIDVENFLILIQAFLGSRAEPEIDGDDLVSFFRSMVRLFTVRPAKDLDAERQGLWGELFMMQHIRGYRFWAPYWHSEVTRLFDFSTSRKRIEVKTTLGQQRIHHFSHRQIWEAEGEEIIVASIMLMEDDAGLSLRELVEECRMALFGMPDYLKLELAVRHAGMNDGSLSGPKFNLAKAEQDLAWFRATDAPHFRMPEPPGVSETRYKVDLSKATPISNEELNKWLSNWASTPMIAAL